MGKKLVACVRGRREFVVCKEGEGRWLWGLAPYGKSAALLDVARVVGSDQLEFGPRNELQRMLLGRLDVPLVGATGRRMVPGVKALAVSDPAELLGYIPEGSRVDEGGWYLPDVVYLATSLAIKIRLPRGSQSVRVAGLSDPCGTCRAVRMDLGELSVWEVVGHAHPVVSFKTLRGYVVWATPLDWVPQLPVGFLDKVAFLSREPSPGRIEADALEMPWPSLRKTFDRYDWFVGLCVRTGEEVRKVRGIYTVMSVGVRESERGQPCRVGRVVSWARTLLWVTHPTLRVLPLFVGCFGF